jgi:hypothetical protein
MVAKLAARLVLYGCSVRLPLLVKRGRIVSNNKRCSCVKHYSLYVLFRLSFFRTVLEFIVPVKMYYFCRYESDFKIVGL